MRKEEVAVMGKVSKHFTCVALFTDVRITPIETQKNRNRDSVGSDSRPLPRLLARGGTQFSFVCFTFGELPVCLHTI